MSKVSNAEMKLQRALEHEGETGESFDPVSGLSITEIKSWLASAAVGLEDGVDLNEAAACCRRNGVAFE